MKQAKVLIVDDDGLLAENLRQTLGEMKYEVVGLAASAAEAVAMAVSAKPDVILMDVRLRGKKNGVQAAAEIGRESDTPIIYLTAYADQALVGRAKKTAPYAYLAKPFRELELRASIEVALYRAQQDRRLKHLNLVLHSLRNINQLITRERDPQRLMDEACRIIVQTRGYLLAWVEKPPKAGGGLTQIWAKAGEDMSFLAELASTVARTPDLSWPGRRALNSSRAAVSHNLAADPAFKSIRKEVTGLGLISMASLPMIHDGRLFGILSLVSRESDTFDDEEVDLLLELAGDLAFGLSAVESEARRRHSEQAVTDAAREWQSTFNAVGDAILVLDANRRILRCNQAARKGLRGGSADPAGQPCYSMVHGPAGPLPDCPFQAMTKSLRRETVERAEDGRWFRITLDPVLDPKGGLSGAICMIRDITESRQSTQALAAERAVLSTLIDNLPDNVFIKDNQGRIILDNIAHRRLLGAAALEDVLGKSDRDFFAPDLADRYMEDERQIVESGQPLADYEEPTVDREGRRLWYLTTKVPVRDEQGRVTALVGINRDITDRKQAEEALRQSEERFRSLYENATIGLYRTTPDGRIIMANSALMRMLGYESFEQLARRDLGKEGYEPGYPRSDFQARLERDGEVRGLEAAWARSDGSSVSVRESARAIKDDKGRTLYYDGTVEDITERKRAEEALRESEDKFRYYFDNSPVGKSITLPTGEVSANKAFCEMLGYAPEELTQTKWQALTHPDDIPATEDAISRVLSGENVSVRFTKRYLRKDGSVVWADVSTALRRDSAGRPLYFMTSVLDISERRQAEQALRESEEHFRKIFEEGSIGMVLTSPEGRFLNVNPAFCRMLGYDQREMMKLTFLDVTHPDHREADRENVRKLWQGQIPGYRTEKRYLGKGGDLRWGRLSASLLRGSDGLPRFALAMVEDITESRRVQEEFRELGRRQEAILASVPDIIMEVDIDKVYTWANQAGRDFFGPDVIGRVASDYFEGEQDTYAQIEPLLRGDTRLFYVESWQRRRDGQKRLLAWWCKSLKDSAGRVVGALSTARDITESKQAELALRESEQKYRDLVENINDVVYNVSPEGAILYLSPVVGRVLGYSAEEIVGKDFPSLFHPEELPRLRAGVSEVMAGRFQPREYRLRRKDGSYIWVQTSSRLIPGTGGQADIITGSFVDINARKLAEEELDQHRRNLEELVRGRTAELQRAHQQISHILQAAGEGIFGLDIQGRLTFINETGSRLLGWTEKEILGREAHNLLHATRPDDGPEKCPILRTLREGGQRAEAQSSFRNKDGSSFPAEFVSTAILENGAPVGAVVVFHDITERKRVEEERKSSTGR
jgi:PAS domain S-box-containing protein